MILIPLQFRDTEDRFLAAELDFDGSDSEHVTVAELWGKQRAFRVRKVGMVFFRENE